MPNNIRLTNCLPERQAVVYFVCLFRYAYSLPKSPFKLRYANMVVFETTRHRNLQAIFGTNLVHWKTRHFASFIVTDHITWVAPGELAIVVTILALEFFSNLAFSTIKK